MKRPTEEKMERLLIHELANKISFLRNYVETRTDIFDEDFITLVSNLDILTKYLLDLKTLNQRTIKREPVSLELILENVTSELETFARLKNVGLRVEVEGACRAIGDPFLIERVVFNLLHNAVKFSPKNSLVLIRCGAEKDSVIVSIENTTSRENLLRYTGTKVGLEISRNILASMEGHLELQTGEDKVTARIYLPLKRPATDVSPN